MKSKILNIYKPLGLSPLEAIRRFIEQNRAYEELKMTYAGRLDPMAEGVLLVLAGDAVHEKDQYLKVEKEYEAEILFSLETDTYDTLGLPVEKERVIITEEKIQKEVAKLKGNISLPLPAYSSYKVKSKPLFIWARAGKLDEVEIPIRKTKIYSIKYLRSYEIDKIKLNKVIQKRIDKVSGDFRQEEIKTQWKKLLKNEAVEKFKVARIKFTVSSGTYIRSIAHELGGRLGTSAILFSLIRTRVGGYEIKDSIKLT